MWVPCTSIISNTDRVGGTLVRKNLNQYHLSTHLYCKKEFVKQHFHEIYQEVLAYRGISSSGQHPKHMSEQDVFSFSQLALLNKFCGIPFLPLPCQVCVPHNSCVINLHACRFTYQVQSFIDGTKLSEKKFFMVSGFAHCVHKGWGKRIDSLGCQWQKPSNQAWPAFWSVNDDESYQQS